MRLALPSRIDLISVPVEAVHGAKVTLSHRWINLGWGYCPTNIPQWNQKYKVAFALLDKADGSIVKTFVVEDSDLSQWLQSKPVTYNTELTLNGFPAGQYLWAVGVVDRTKNDAIGINLSVKKDFLTADGWVKIKEVTIKQ